MRHEKAHARVYNNAYIMSNIIYIDGWQKKMYGHMAWVDVKRSTAVPSGLRASTIQYQATCLIPRAMPGDSLFEI